MTKYSKINIVYHLQKWMDSVPGQTFLNYAYSWGAAVVILGTLFKLTHLPGANLMLFIGMGTEVVVFFLSAFDRPFDKTAEGRELPTHLEGEEEAKAFAAQNQSEAVSGNVYGVPVAAFGTPGVVGGTSRADAPPASAAESSVSGASVSGAPTSAAAFVGVPLQANPEMEEAQNNYIDQLKRLVETLGKVNEQSVKLTRDSEEMENLNRTLTGITRVYEMQLKSASQQITTIDDINLQTKKMAQQIEQLNKIYTRMIDAMTVNMQITNPTAAPTR